MTTTRAKGRVSFECDVCGKKKSCDPDDFILTWDDLRDEGWRAFKDSDDEWQHRCPKCVGK